MSRNYSGILGLLRDDGKDFQERMVDLGSDTIAEILAATEADVPGKKFEAEYYYTLLGTVEGNLVVCQAVDYQTQGNTGRVEFDWQRVRERHKSHGDVVGWFHEHPPGAHYMSQMDWNTFQSWVMALDVRPRYAIIKCEYRFHAWELTRDGTDMQVREVSAQEFGESGYIIDTTVEE